MVAQETMDTIEKTLDVVEGTLDTVERIPKVHLNGTTKAQQLIILGVTAAASASAASFVTYKLVRKRLKLRYEQLATDEIEEARRYYGRLHKTDDSVATPEAAVQTLVGPTVQTARTMDAVIDELAYRAFEDTEKLNDTTNDEPTVVDEEDSPLSTPKAKKTTKKVETVSNIFEARDSSFVWDQTVEESKRDPSLPYVISLEEFNDNDFEHEQSTLTYYDGGDVGVLADERDQMVDNTDQLVGETNLLHRFGHGSQDQNVLYIRNERIETDFEIARSKMSYAKDVLGFDDEADDLSHSDHRPLRFRDRE